jgi:hypothetical protein
MYESNVPTPREGSMDVLRLALILPWYENGAAAIGDFNMFFWTIVNL